MITKFDEEIQQVEARLAREREALVHQAEDLGHTARDAAVSPKGLIAAVAIGFMLGELTRHRRHTREAIAAPPRKLGLGGILGGAVLAFVKAKYGSPGALSRAAWEYAAAQRARKDAATARAAAAGAAAANAATTEAATASGTYALQRRSMP